MFISEEEQLLQLQELAHLRKQRTELQTDNTRLELENRDLRAIVRRVMEPPTMTDKETKEWNELTEEQRAARVPDELRRASIWSRLHGVFGVKE